MDRRRKLFVLFLIALAIAIWDVRVNGIDVIDQWARLLEVRFEGVRGGEPALFAEASALHVATHSAADISTFVLRDVHGSVEIHGADTDVVRVEMTAYTSTGEPAGARAYAERFTVALERVGDELHTDWRRPEATESVRLAQAAWRITVPRDMGVAVAGGPGFVRVQDTAGPVRVESTGAWVHLRPAAAAPVHIDASGGEVAVELPERDLNYDLRVAVRFGSLSYPVRWSQGGGGVLRTREGRVTEVTGALGGGEHALAVQMNGGTVRLQVVP